MRYAIMIAVTASLVVAGAGIGFGLDAVGDGKKLYAEKKCQMCHSIAGVGNKKNPLDGVGSKLKPEEIEKWIQSPKEMKADSKMKAYPEITGKALEDLTAYMLSVK